MYKLIFQVLLPNNQYRNIIYFPLNYSKYDIRTKEKLTLNELLNKIWDKYKVELCQLDCNYIINLVE